MKVREGDSERLRKYSSIVDVVGGFRQLADEDGQSEWTRDPGLSTKLSTPVLRGTRPAIIRTKKCAVGKRDAKSISSHALLQPT